MLSFSHFERQPEDDPARGTDENGNTIWGPQGQNEWHTTNLWRRGQPKKLPPPRNVTISFAKRMMDNGGVPKGTSTEAQTIIHQLLEVDRNRNHPSSAPQPEAAPRPEVALLGAHGRPCAKKIFPGKKPKGKQLLWTFSGTNPTSQAGHFRKVQFQRMLYDDGVDANTIKACKNNIELATLWQKHRDAAHPLEADELAVENGRTAAVQDLVINFDAPDANTAFGDTEDPEALPETLNPVNMAAQDDMQPQGYSTALPYTNGSLTAANSHAYPVFQPVATTGPSLPRKATIKPANHKDPEMARRIALAARVGRFPLSLPGNNHGRPLTMRRTIQGGVSKPIWDTYRAKYNKAMVTQLLKDYNVLPPNAAKMANDALCQHLVSEREKLYANNIPLQDAWTNDRLEEYVADQEARGLIPPAAVVIPKGNSSRSVIPQQITKAAPRLMSLATPSSLNTPGPRAISRKRNLDVDNDSDSDTDEYMFKKPKTQGKSLDAWMRAPLEDLPRPAPRFVTIPPYYRIPVVDTDALPTRGNRQEEYEMTYPPPSAYTQNGQNMHASPQVDEEPEIPIDPRLL